MRIVAGDFDHPNVRALIETHAATARAQTARGSAHSLDRSGLRAPGVSFWTAWDGEALLGIGALRRLSPEHAEIKSMHTAETARGKGVGAAMLAHIVAAAREQGVTRLSLETGSWDYFEPARRLYRKYGFTPCPPFADYAPDPNSVFMTMALERTAGSEMDTQ